MSGDRLFFDTSFVLALLDRRDTYHRCALTLVSRVEEADELWITEAILIEVANALSRADRTSAIEFIERCYAQPEIRVVTVDTPLLRRACQLYAARSDKTWGLTDCISYVVMRENGLTDALTADRHFIQAGFRAPLLEQS
jgi:predicted nucleic acid-binding protein